MTDDFVDDVFAALTADVDVEPVDDDNPIRFNGEQLTVSLNDSLCAAVASFAKQFGNTIDGLELEVATPELSDDGTDVFEASAIVEHRLAVNTQRLGDLHELERFASGTHPSEVADPWCRALSFMRSTVMSSDDDEMQEYAALFGAVLASLLQAMTFPTS